MKVVGGELKGKQLSFVRSKHVRPMTEKVRAAIYDILQDRIEGALMLDLFCGSGSVGIEGLSRGAHHVDFVDTETSTVVENIRQLGIVNRVSIYRKEALRALNVMQNKDKAYDFIFVGAPYAFPKLNEVLQMIDRFHILNPAGVLMIEHRKGGELTSEFSSFCEKKKYGYGQTIITLYVSTL